MNVALGISTNKIKVVALKGRQVKKFASADLPDGMVRDGLILQPKAVGEAIDKLFKSAGVSRDNVVIGLAGLSFTYRFLKLPRMKARLLDEAIIRAARKEISLPLDELYLSWQQLPEPGDELSFFVLGVPRNLIDAVLDTLKAAGIPPYLMGLRPLALARAAEKSDAIIVNMQADSFDIVFMSGGIPRVIHTITPRGLGSTLEDNIRRLADELTKTAAFYQSTHPDTSLDASTPLLLTGDTVTDSPAPALLQNEVEYPVGPLTADVEIPEGMPLGSYVATIGLALKKSPPKTATKDEASNFIDVNINLLAGKYRKPKAKPKNPAYMLLGVLLAAAVLLLYPLYQARAQIKIENAALETDLNDAKRQLNIASIVNEDNLVIEENILSLNAAADALKNTYTNILGGRGHVNSDLELVTSLLPSRALFTSVEITGDRITMTGEADTVFTVTDYARALESAGVFQKVRIDELAEGASTITLDEETDPPTPLAVIKFAIVISLNKLDSAQ